MSYRCQICDAVSRKGESCKRWPVYKEGTRQLAQEIPVCKDCMNELVAGTPLSELRLRKAAPVEVVPMGRRQPSANGPTVNEKENRTEVVAEVRRPRYVTLGVKKN